jgi:uncharacterized protein YjiS (DUF1127 family)
VCIAGAECSIRDAAAGPQNSLLRGVIEMATHVIDPRCADLLAGHAQSVTTRRLSELFARVNGWLAERRHYRTTVAELSALTDQQLADVGVLPGEIHRVARHLASQARAGR